MVNKSASRVAVVGTGAIGSAVVRVLLKGGYDVTVWNRTAGRAAELVAEGAVRAGSVQEAVSSAPLVLLTLTDHAAVRQCLTQVDLSGQTVVGMYTGTADDARQAAGQVSELGGHYVDAGIQTAPEAIGTDTATILYSGSRPAFDQHRAVFDLVSTPRFVGEAPDAAASGTSPCSVCGTTPSSACCGPSTPYARRASTWLSSAAPRAPSSTT